MTWRERLEHATGAVARLPPLDRRVVIGVVVAAVLVGVVTAVAARSSAGTGELDLPMARVAPSTAPTAPSAATSGAIAPNPERDAGGPPGTTGELVIAAAGAVVVPGVYRLPMGARVADVVAAAGGLDPTADVDRINLAGSVHDGERVYIPRRDQSEVPQVVAGEGSGSGSPTPGSSGGSGGQGGSPTTTAPQLIDLNTATANQLDALPGVGPATAAAILAYRDAHGRFRSIDELAEVRGIGPSKLEQLRPLVTVR